MPPKKATKEAIKATQQQRDAVGEYLDAWQRLAALHALSQNIDPSEHPRRRLFAESLGQLIVGQLASVADASRKGKPVPVDPRKVLEAVKSEWHQRQLLKHQPWVEDWFKRRKKHGDIAWTANLDRELSISWPAAGFEFPVALAVGDPRWERAENVLGVNGPREASYELLARVCGCTARTLKDAGKLKLPTNQRTPRRLPPTF